MSEAGITGCRLNLVGAASLPDAGSAHWQKFIGLVAEKRWQIELHCRPPELLKLLPPLIGSGCAVVIDHFGLPDPQHGPQDAQWRSVLEHGKSGALWIKISAAYRCGPLGRSIARDCYPVLRDTIGIHRLMWGSDWPHTQFEASESFAANRSFLDEMVSDPAERSIILSNPARLFGFEADGG